MLAAAIYIVVSAERLIRSTQKFYWTWGDIPLTHMQKMNSIGRIVPEILAILCHSSTHATDTLTDTDTPVTNTFGRVKIVVSPERFIRLTQNLHWTYRSATCTHMHDIKSIGAIASEISAILCSRRLPTPVS